MQAYYQNLTYDIPIFLFLLRIQKGNYIMASEKMDRRVRKTRAQLLQGLIQLMGKKDIKDISVKELADLVDINRGTFYLHYNDIYDMLGKIEDELFSEFNEILDRNFTEVGTTHSSNPALQEIFIFLSNNRDLVRVMIGPHGDLTFVNRLKNLVKERLEHMFQYEENTLSDFEYYYSFLVSGCIGVIETWLDSAAPKPPEEIAALCSQMIGNRLNILR